MPTKYHVSLRKILSVFTARLAPGGWGVLPYMGFIGMCGAKGYGFSAALVINRVSVLAILVINRVSIFAI